MMSWIVKLMAQRNSAPSVMIISFCASVDLPIVETGYGLMYDA